MSIVQIIKSDDDLKKHFKSHDVERERLMELRMNHSDMLSDDYLNIVKAYDKLDISYGEFGLSFEKIVMWHGHEGDVINNIRFCPFCGIEFEVREVNENVEE